MPFNMRLRPYIIILTCLLTSCVGSKIQIVNKFEKPAEKVRMLYYDQAFTFDTTSKLRLDGYYQIRQIFGSHTTNDKDYYPNDPTFGYLQFFPDGFCKVGWWNGFFESPTEIKNEIANNKAFGFWGIYKLKGDTLQLEYLYNPASAGVHSFQTRNTLTALIKTNEIFVTIHDNIKYSFPEVEKDLLTSSCTGKFMNVQTQYNKLDNYLKRNIHNYQ